MVGTSNLGSWNGHGYSFSTSFSEPSAESRRPSPCRCAAKASIHGSKDLGPGTSEEVTALENGWTYLVIIAGDLEWFLLISVNMLLIIWILHGYYLIIWWPYGDYMMKTNDDDHMVMMNILTPDELSSIGLYTYLAELMMMFTYFYWSF